MPRSLDGDEVPEVELSESQLMALAIIRSTPGGVSGSHELSARSFGQLDADASEQLLGYLFGTDLLTIKERVILVDGRTRKRGFFILSSLAWASPQIRTRIDELNLPISALVHLDPTDQIPERFFHHFWNANPSKLSINNDGTYIALRLFETANDFEAESWALTTIPKEKLVRILSIRDVDPKIKRLVEVYCGD